MHQASIAFWLIAGTLFPTIAAVAALWRTWENGIVVREILRKVDHLEQQLERVQNDGK